MIFQNNSMLTNFQDLGMRLHRKRLPSGSNMIRYEFTDLTNWQEKYRATWMLRIEIY